MNQSTDQFIVMMQRAMQRLKGSDFSQEEIDEIVQITATLPYSFQQVAEAFIIAKWHCVNIYPKYLRTDSFVEIKRMVENYKFHIDTLEGAIIKGCYRIDDLVDEIRISLGLGSAYE